MSQGRPILLILLACWCWLAVPVLPASILVLLPFPGYSHTMPFMPIFKELGNRGHELTMVTPFPQNPNPKGFKQINVDLNLTTIQDVMWSAMGGKPKPKDMSVFKVLMFQLAGMLAMCPILAPLMLERIKPVMPPAGTKFDLIIIEPFFCMETLIGSSFLYDAPVVATLPMPLHPMSAVPIGNPLSLAYTPNSRLPYSSNMTFFERVWNTIINVLDLVINKYKYLPDQDKLMREAFGRPEMPYIGDLLQNISLILMETHFSLNYPRAYLKNVVEVGGVSLGSFKPLTKDLEKYMDEAKDGVIFFSWGSHFEFDDAEDLVKSLMTTFSKLKQRVIFKWADTNISGKPDNVLVQKWIPQPAILNHKNTVLFISHCGLNSMYEAAYFGVPVVGTPLFGDQPYNLKVLEHFGMALGVDEPLRIESSSEPLTEVINKVLSDPRYKENAMERRAALRDRPQPVLSEAVYWVEYILRHGGQNLKPHPLPWYSIALLDVFLFLALVLTTPFFLLCVCLRLCKRKHPPKPEPSKKKKKE